LGFNKFENCLYKSVRSLEVQKLLFQQFLNLSSSHVDHKAIDVQTENKLASQEATLVPLDGPWLPLLENPDF
jgi:hypothetical protein